jgi:hypothetical protein
MAGPERVDPRWVSVLDEDLSDVDLEAQIAAVKRELALRGNVYPKRVASGDMRQDEADRELRNMRAVLKTLFQLQRAAAAAERQAPSLLSSVLGLGFL